MLAKTGVSVQDTFDNKRNKTNPLAHTATLAHAHGHAQIYTHTRIHTYTKGMKASHEGVNRLQSPL